MKNDACDRRPPPTDELTGWSDHGLTAVERTAADWRSEQSEESRQKEYLVTVGLDDCRVTTA